MEAFIDPDGRIQDVWPTVLAIPGFIGGVVFSVLLAIGERGSNPQAIKALRKLIFACEKAYERRYHLMFSCD